eukprot:3624122-Pyramimonas_sp.AAC.1
MNSGRYCLAHGRRRSLQQVAHWSSQEPVVIEQRAHDVELLRARRHEARLPDVVLGDVSA